MHRPPSRNKRQSAGRTSRFFKPQRGGESKPGASNGPLRVRVVGLSDEGRGIAYRVAAPAIIDAAASGAVEPEMASVPIFIAGALPGESATIRITQRHKRYSEAELVSLDVTADERIEPDCAHFTHCGGCQLQMLPHSAQLAHKQKVLERLLGPLAVGHWAAPLVADPWGYRHRARLAVQADSQGLPLVGFRSFQSHRVAAVNSCPVLDPALQRLLPLLPQWLGRLEGWPLIEELRLAIDARGRVGLGWHGRRLLSRVDANRLTMMAKAEGVLVGADADLLYENEEGWGFRFGLADFTQVNPAINRRLVALACQWLEAKAGDHIADYFCGLGNFSLALARRGARITGLEADEGMVARAADNAVQAGLARSTRFDKANLFTAPVLAAGATKALLDPPRAGARSLCEQLAQASVERIVYVSCNPHTLARDLAILVQGGFSVERAAMVDMFPHTGHIEAIVSLRR